MRASTQDLPYRNLDYGPCPISGPQQPVIYENEFIQSKVCIPEKCRRCRHLHSDPTRGFVCNYEREKWGDFPRALDWGLWSPERSDLHLDSGRSLTQEFMSAVERGDQVHAIRVFRDQHRDATLKEAREAFLELSAKL
jgi:hypothetical protein